MQEFKISKNRINMEKFKLISTLFISILLIFSGCTAETDSSQLGLIAFGSSSSGSSSKEDSKTPEPVIKTKKQTVTFSNTNANFTMIDISFIDGRTSDSIILGEDLLEVPYTTNVKPFRLAMYETSYNTWYEVLKWAENNGYTIVNKGVEGVFGEVENEKNMSDAGAEPKLVEMPVCRLYLARCNGMVQCIKRNERS